MFKYHNKSQISLEFLFFIGLLVIILMGFLVFSVSQSAELFQKRNSLLLKQTAISIQRELVLATYVENGYKRTFSIPVMINQHEFELIVLNSILLVNSAEDSYQVRLPEFSGNLRKGKNHIIKHNNTIIIY